MEGILNSAKSIVDKWARTQSPLIADASTGDTEVSILTTRRFRRGDQIVIRNSENQGEFHTISDISDCSKLTLSSPVKFNWSATDSMVDKTWNYHFLQGVYLGDVTNIPKYPAVVIEADDKNSEWLTLGSTTERHNVTFKVYVDAGWQESGYLWMIRMAEAIEEGLKRNFYPLVAPYNVVTLTEDALAGDKFIKVADTSEVWYPARAYMEDPFHFNEIGVKKVIDGTTIELSEPLCDNYLVDYNPILIFTTRLVYNSWPSSINYGTVYKGTFLKSASISWFVEEQEVQCEKRGEPHLF